MLYVNKHNQRIITRMRRLADRRHPEQRQEKLLARDLAGISRGGERERSSKKMVGNIARKNVAAKYDAIGRAHKKIERMYNRRIENVRGY
jgi:hypothetical protein